MNHLFACMVAGEFPLQSLLRLRPELEQLPVVVLDGESPSEQVCSLNEKALTLGVAPGMKKVETDMFPALWTLSRSLSTEASTRTALLECAGCFSPLVEDQSTNGSLICVADITGTEKLFGPPEILAERMRTQAQALRIHTSVAVSSNFDASICLAIAHANGICVVPPGEERAALASLPLETLALSIEHAETFAMWGIHTLGELASLHETELVIRLGQAGKLLHMLARGEAPHLFRAIEPAFLLQERIDLDTPVEQLDSLLFFAGVMLDQLIVRLRARILALASLTLELSLDDGTVHSRTVRPALASNDRQLWLKLAHLDLQAYPPRASIRSLLLHGEPGSTSKVQFGLFSPQIPEPMRLDLTLARIRNIVGEDAVGYPELKDTHRPDSFRVAPFCLPATSSRALPGAVTGMQRIAMRQLRPSETATVILRDQQPASLVFREKRYIVEHAYGPWSSAGDWWKPELWAIEQWDLVARGQNSPAWLCCCLTHDLAHGIWRIEALYD